MTTRLHIENAKNAGKAFGLVFLIGALSYVLIRAISSWGDPTDDLPPAAPTPPPVSSNPAIKVEQVEVGGLLYNCVRIYSSGIDCDWSRPLNAPTAGGAK